MTGIKFIKTRTDLTARSEEAYLYMINSIKEMVVVKLKQ
jgi:hypothetical protein